MGPQPQGAVLTCKRSRVRRAKENRDLDVDAAEIRMCAERRLGEMIAARKAGAGLSTGGRPMNIQAYIDEKRAQLDKLEHGLGERRMGMDCPY